MNGGGTVNYDSTGFLEEADYNDLEEIIEETGYEPFFFSAKENMWVLEETE